MRELFMEELELVVGGRKPVPPPPPPPKPCPCCLPTTLACCEEGECDTCCDII